MADKGANNKPRATFALPNRWAVNQLTLHYEGLDLTKEEEPFTPIIMVQLRMDVRPGTPMSDVLARDLAVLKAMNVVEMLESDELEIEGRKVQYLEWVQNSADLQTLRQLVFYFEHGARTYAITATAKPDDFEEIRGDVQNLAASLLSNPEPLGGAAKQK
jgi:hypothetical protein